MTLSIEHYWPFSFLALIPIIWVLWHYSLAGLGTFRRYTILILRFLLLLLLILCLANVTILHKSRLLTVCMVLDRSASIPHTIQDETETLIGRTIQSMNPKDERITAWTFTEEPYSEFQDQTGKEKFHRLETEFTEAQQQHTDIEKALKIALATMPEQGERRLLLVTDGNETTGNCLSPIALAKERKIPIDVLPLNFRQETFGQEVIFEKLVAPQDVYENRPYRVQAIVNSNQATTATIHLSLNDMVVGSPSFQLQPGKNRLEIVIPGQVVKSGYQNIKAILEAQLDSNFNNNSSQAFSYASGVPKILFLDRDLEHNQFIPNALQKAQQGGQPQFNVEIGGTKDFPRSLMALNAYDVVILSNIHSDDLGKDAMMMLESAIKEDGLGLIMIGGENSFGAGGYRDTPVERALPIYMDIRHKKIIPNGALGIILHTCEFPDGNGWAKRITHAAIDLLSDADYAGVLNYSYSDNNSWIFPMITIAGNRSKMHSLIEKAEPGDMPEFTTTLNAAYQSLQKVPSSKKHIIIISDGDPAPPSNLLVGQIRQSKISISCIAIYPHIDQDVGRMRYMAESTGGRYYLTRDVSELPSIFTKETLEVRRNLIIEDEKGFATALNHSSDLIRGLPAWTRFYGYVATSPKPEAQTPLSILDGEEHDPLLAHWQYGLGRTVAFTSDAKNRWAKDWVGSPEFSQFWIQTARWVQRKVEQSEFQIHNTIQNNQVKVAIDAVNNQGEFVNLLTMQGTARILPAGSNVPITQHFVISQVGPGRYEGEFPMSQPGLCLITVGYQQDQARKQVRSGFYMSQSSEHLQTKPNLTLLQQIAQQTGGRFLQYTSMDVDQDGKILAKEWVGAKTEFDKLDLNADSALTSSEIPQDEKIFLHGTPQLGNPTPIWPWLVQIFFCLFALDVAIRRVMIDYQQLRQKFLVVIHRGAPAKSDAGVQTMGQLKQKKQKIREQFTARNVNLDDLESIGNKASSQATAQKISTPSTPMSPLPTVTPTVAKPTSVAKAPPKESPATENAPVFTEGLLKAVKKTRKK